MAEFPGGSLGECSVSADEGYIVTAMKRDDKSHITVTATDSSGGEVIYTSPDQTIIHPQFHPKHPDLIAYSGDPAPRMWTIRRDGTENLSLYQHDNYEFLVHETFLGALDELIVIHWPYALRRMSLETLQMQTIADFNAWHIASNRDGNKGPVRHRPPRYRFATWLMWRQANTHLSVIRRVHPVGASGKLLGMRSLRIGQRHNNPVIGRNLSVGWR